MKLRGSERKIQKRGPEKGARKPLKPNFISLLLKTSDKRRVLALIPAVMVIRIFPLLSCSGDKYLKPLDVGYLFGSSKSIFLMVVQQLVVIFVFS